MREEEITFLRRLVDRDPLTVETEVKRRNLLFVSCFSILLAVYGLRVKRTPWLEFEIPPDSPNMLQGALAIALVYTLTIFVTYAWTDVRRWLTSVDVLNFSSYAGFFRRTEHLISAVDEQLKQPAEHWQSQQVQIDELLAQIKPLCAELDAGMHGIRTGFTTIKYVQWVRLSLLDIGLPVALALFGLWKTASEIVPFLAVIVR